MLLALALIGVAQFSPKEPFPQTPAAQVWGIVHGVLLLLGYVEEKTPLLEIRAVLFPNADDRLESGLFLENDLGFFAVVPKIGLCRELV